MGLTYPLAELDRIIPGDVIDGMVVADYAGFHGLDDLLVLEKHLTLKDARVLTHDAQVLVLGDLVDPHVEAFGDGDLVLLLRWLGSWLTRCGTHRERSRWDVGQLESDAVCDVFSWWRWLAARTADCGNQEQNGCELKGAAHWKVVQEWSCERLGGDGETAINHSSWTWKSLKL